MEAHPSELRVLCSFQVITTIKEYKLPLLSARGRCFTCGFLLEPYHSLGRQMLAHFLDRGLRPTEGLPAVFAESSASLSPKVKGSERMLGRTEEATAS